MVLNLFPILFLASLYFLIFYNVHILLFYNKIFIFEREESLPVFPTNPSLLHICLCSLITINCIKIPPRSPARDLGETPGISHPSKHSAVCPPLSSSAVDFDPSLITFCQSPCLWSGSLLHQPPEWAVWNAVSISCLKFFSTSVSTVGYSPGA